LQKSNFQIIPFFPLKKDFMFQIINKTFKKIMFLLDPSLAQI
jgi:hypothetical protein